MFGLSTLLSLCLPDGVEHLVLVNVAGILVVVVMRHLPGVVGDQNEAMEEVSNLEAKI